MWFVFHPRGIWTVPACVRNVVSFEAGEEQPAGVNQRGSGKICMSREEVGVGSHNLKAGERVKEFNCVCDEQVFTESHSVTFTA